MTDPTRLLDGSADDLERALLRAGTDYGASPGLREKTLAALAATGAGAAVGGAALSASGAKLGASSLVAKLGAAKVAVVTLALGAAAAVPVVLSLRSTEPAAVVDQAPQHRVVDPRPAQLESRSPEHVPLAPVVPSTPSEALVPAPVQPRLPNRAPGATEAAEALRVELSKLDVARSTLKSGRPDAALALLEAYDRSTPRGKLKLEAEVLRIDALSRSGRLEQAKSRARAFLKRYPRSVLAARVRQLAGP